MNKLLLFPALLALAACGPTQPLGEGGSGGGSTGTGGGDPGAQTLWPLTAGSTWKYKITDPNLGVFEKTVTMNGKQPLPGGDPNVTYWQMESDENQPNVPLYREISWQLDQNGISARVREDDFSGSALTDSTVWDPDTVKMLSAPQAKGWSYTSTAKETVRWPDGSIKTQHDIVYVWRVDQVDESVTVPMGTFQALRVARTRPDKPDYLRTYWLVPGLGKVKEDGNRREELESADVK